MRAAVCLQLVLSSLSSVKLGCHEAKNLASSGIFAARKGQFMQGAAVTMCMDYQA